MPTPGIKACHLAVCAALTATSAQAVYVSQNGTGQVLIFPHYTVRNGLSTLISVDNTQGNTKAVKMRFREGLNGREVFNFNLYLSPNDTWTGAVVETAAGARLITNDNSCASPSDLFTETRADALGLALNAFKNYQYTGSFQDVASLASLDRTREGYFEIIEMGVIVPGLSSTAAQIVANVAQNAAGIPANCGAMNAFDGFIGNPAPIRFPNTGAALMSPPTGGLMGRASLIGAASGSNYSFSPTVLDAWSSRVAYAAAGDSAGTLLSDVFPVTSTMMTPGGVVTATWARGRDAVSAVLMRETLTNDFVLDSGTNSRTDWIVTFPTKNFYTTSSPSPSAEAPFGSGFASDGSGSCDPYTYVVADRESSTAVRPIIIGVPPPGFVSTTRLCWTANVVPFSTSLLASRLANPLSADLENTVRTSTTTPGPAATPSLRGGTQGPNGKLTVRFGQGLTPLSAILISPSGATANIPGRHFGFPAIGMMLHNYQNANVVSNYGGVVEHAYSVRVE